MSLGEPETRKRGPALAEKCESLDTLFGFAFIELRDQHCVRNRTADPDRHSKQL
jgi:hypothetical protein